MCAKGKVNKANRKVMGKESIFFFFVKANFHSRFCPVWPNHERRVKKRAEQLKKVINILKETTKLLWPFKILESDEIPFWQPFKTSL